MKVIMKIAYSRPSNIKGGCHKLSKEQMKELLDGRKTDK